MPGLYKDDQVKESCQHPPQEGEVMVQSSHTPLHCHTNNAYVWNTLLHEEICSRLPHQLSATHTHNTMRNKLTHTVSGGLHCLFLSSDKNRHHGLDHSLTGHIVTVCHVNPLWLSLLLLSTIYNGLYNSNPQVCTIMGK